MRNKRSLIFLVGVLALAGVVSNVFAEESDSVKIEFIDGDTGEIINNRQICLELDSILSLIVWE